MLTKSVDLRLMVKIARLYYVEGLNQEDISVRFRTSRSTVSRLLKQAKEHGVVSVAIHEPEEARYTSLEQELERRYGLMEAVVLESGATPEENLHQLGRAAAEYLLRVIKPGQTIGVSYGKALQKTVQALEPQTPTRVVVVPLVGGSGRVDPEVHANQLAISLARSLGGQCYALHAPAVTSSPELRNALMADAGVAEVLGFAARCDVALVGVGSPYAGSTMRQTGYVNSEEIEAFRAMGAAGDCCSQFFDVGGEPCALELASRVVGLPLVSLRSIPVVIGVAGGEEKVPALQAAMRGRFVKVLVTDSATAQGLLLRTEGLA